MRTFSMLQDSLFWSICGIFSLLPIFSGFYLKLLG